LVKVLDLPTTEDVPNSPSQQDNVAHVDAITKMDLADPEFYHCQDGLTVILFQYQECFTPPHEHPSTVFYLDDDHQDQYTIFADSE
jgi:hypothetical protein